MDGKVRIWDFVLAAGLLLLSLSVVLLPDGKQGNSVTVSVNGAVAAVLPLNEDAELPLDGATVVVRDGTVFLTDSTCPDHLCERMGAIRAAGQTILCLPNRIAVRITAEEVDAIVG